jgi:hypothetical protein
MRRIGEGRSLLNCPPPYLPGTKDFAPDFRFAPQRSVTKTPLSGAHALSGVVSNDIRL